MLLSQRGHWISIAILAIATVFTGIALFTCGWTDINSRLGPLFHETSAGLFYQDYCDMGLYERTSWNRPAWITVTLILLSIAFALQILVIAVGLFGGFYHTEKFLVFDVATITLAALCLIVGVFLYPIASAVYWSDYQHLITEWSFGYSFYLAIVAAVLTLLAIVPVSHALSHVRRHGDYHRRRNCRSPDIPAYMHE